MSKHVKRTKRGRRLRRRLFWTLVVLGLLLLALGATLVQALGAAADAARRVERRLGPFPARRSVRTESR